MSRLVTSIRALTHSSLFLRNIPSGRNNFSEASNITTIITSYDIHIRLPLPSYLRNLLLSHGPRHHELLSAVVIWRGAKTSPMHCIVCLPLTLENHTLPFLEHFQISMRSRVVFLCLESHSYLGRLFLLGFHFWYPAKKMQCWSAVTGTKNQYSSHYPIF